MLMKAQSCLAELLLLLCTKFQHLMWLHNMEASHAVELAAAACISDQTHLELLHTLKPLGCWGCAHSSRQCSFADTSQQIEGFV